MDEIKVEDAKKELEGIVAATKEAQEKENLAKLPESERVALDTKKREEAKKAESDRLAAEEAKKKDDAVLAKKPEERTEEEKKRAGELEEEKRKSEEAKLSAKEKIERIKEESQKRINEVVNELKQIKDKSSKDAETLRVELDTLRKQNEELSKKVQQPVSDKDALRSQLFKSERDRINQYLEEDSSLPREQRREMSKSELEDWLLEDMASAQEWIASRTLRRYQERSQEEQSLTARSRIDALAKKQTASLDRVIAKHPELKDANSDKSKVLKAIFSEIGSDLLSAENGPELAAAEMEKRLSKPVNEPTEEQKRIDDLTKQLEEMQAEIQSLRNGDEGINSTVVRTRKPDGKMTDGEEQLVKTMQELNASEDAIQNALKKYREKGKSK